MEIKLTAYLLLISVGLIVGMWAAGELFNHALQKEERREQMVCELHKKQGYHNGDCR